MKLSPIQTETFAGNTAILTANAASKAVKKGYSVLIDGQKYFVDSHNNKVNPMDIFVKSSQTSPNKAIKSSLNILA